MATIAPILAADPVIQVHVVAALAAVVLAPVQLLRLGRGRVHRVIGYVWVVSMAVTALSSFLIHEIQLVGPFSPIHLLSIYLIWGLWMGVRYAATGQFVAHRRMMRAITLQALAIAGVFTLLPGRIMNAALFGEFSVTGFVAAMVVASLGLAVLYVRRQRPARA